MSEDRISRALRKVGDDYLERKPADFQAFRAQLERKKKRRSTWWAATGTAVGAAALAAFLMFANPPADDGDLPTAGEVAELARVTRAALPGIPQEVTGGSDAAFVSLPSIPAIARVEEETGRITWTQQLPAPARDLIQEGDELWVAMPEADAIARIDQASGEYEQIGLGGATEPTRLHVGGGAVRVATADGVVRLDRVSLTPELIYEGSVTDIAMGSSALWVLTTGNELLAIDPDTGADAGLGTQQLNGDGAEITYLRDSIWFAPAGQTSITRIEESTGQKLDPVGLRGGGYIDMDAGDQGLWVLVRESVGSSMYPLSDEGVLGEDPVEFETAATDLSVNEQGIWVALDNGAVVQLDDRDG